MNSYQATPVVNKSRFIITVLICTNLSFAFLTSAGTGKKGDKSVTISCIFPLPKTETFPFTFPYPYLQYRWMVDDRAELGISNVLVLPEFDMTTCLVRNPTKNIALSMGAWVGLSGAGLRLLFNCWIFNCGLDSPHYLFWVPLPCYAGMKIPFKRCFSLTAEVVGLYTNINPDLMHLQYRWQPFGNVGLQISW